ncbi:TPA: hypothetical protein NKT40_001058 [Vibrio parahaemolyticus]|uniref:hypothetical protein n=1 Tax=Vibrio alginolyticus TaxID=663 RepID=UPI001BD35F65|nr:hypothetical protein [Vibrio alginolyticus]MBS9955704.1 hypothetical protein [Vibrio alginolyticus]HCH2708211.1 hypothetical protein [Vibrio parahaemolyticus]
MISLDEIACELHIHGFYMCEWSDLVESANIDEKTSEGLKQFSEALALNKIQMLPKIVSSTKGYSVACVSKSLSDKTLIFSHPHHPIDKSKRHIKRALLTARIATTMAKVDGFIEQAEIDSLRIMIYSLAYLSESDKYAIFIRGVYFLQQGFRQDDLLNSFKKYEFFAQKEILEVAKTIAVSDGKIDSSEKFFLRHLYKACGLPTNSLASDLKLHAKKCGIEINSRREQSQTVQDIDVDEYSVLESLIDDFLEF